MADVGRRGPSGRQPTAGRSGTTGRARDRGQLILVTALSLSILFVSLALILNTAIYTENLATRSSDIGGGTDAVRYHDAARDGTGGLIEYVNYHNNTSHAELTANLSTGVEAFGDDSARQFATSTRAVETSLVSSQNATRVAQTDDSRNFSNVSGAADWTVASGVDNTRAVRFHVSNSSLTGIIGDNYRMSVTDGSATWNLTIYEPVLGTVEVIVDGPTVTDSCAAPTDASGMIWINVSEETIGGTSCPALGTFADGLGSPYDVTFVRGDMIDGTYTMVVDDPALAGSPSPHLASPGAGQPFATHAVYSATVEIEYHTPRLQYAVDVRVAPGEPT